MNRERALKIVLVIVGLLFSAGIYPVVRYFLQGSQNENSEIMMISLYATLGIFLLLAVRNPSSNRSLIAFTAWSSFAHAAVMAVMAAMAFERVHERNQLLISVAPLVIIGLLLVTLAPKSVPV